MEIYNGNLIKKMQALFVMRILTESPGRTLVLHLDPIQKAAEAAQS